MPPCPPGPGLPPLARWRRCFTLRAGLRLSGLTATSRCPVLWLLCMEPGTGWLGSSEACQEAPLLGSLSVTSPRWPGRGPHSPALAQTRLGRNEILNPVLLNSARDPRVRSVLGLAFITVTSRQGDPQTGTSVLLVLHLRPWWERGKHKPPPPHPGRPPAELPHKPGARDLQAARRPRSHPAGGRTGSGTVWASPGVSSRGGLKKSASLEHLFPKDRRGGERGEGLTGVSRTFLPSACPAQLRLWGCLSCCPSARRQGALPGPALGGFTSGLPLGLGFLVCKMGLRTWPPGDLR